jgi:hypothetical protein
MFLFNASKKLNNYNSLLIFSKSHNGYFMKLKNLFIVFCLMMIAMLHSATEAEQKIAGVEYGFSDPIANAKPENTSLMKIGYQGALGFPYKDRELGCKLPSTTTINKLKLELELLRDVSQISKFGIDKNIKLYVSVDNAKFHLVTPCNLELKLFKRDGKNWIKIEMTGFSENAKYLKLCPRKGIKGYAGIIKHGKLQNVFHVYKIPQLSDATNPRFMTEDLEVKANLNINDHEKTPEIKVCLKIKDKWQTFIKKTLSQNGKTSLELKKSLPENLPYGKYPIRIELIDNKGNIADSKDSYFYHVNKISSKPPKAGEIQILSPSESGILYGKWLAKTARNDCGKNVNYVEATAPECSYTLNLPSSGHYAVYIGMIGGESVAKITTPDKNTPQIIRLKTWRIKTLNKSTAGEVFVGIYKNGKIKISPQKTQLKLSHIRLQGLTDSQIKLVDSKAEIVPRLILHRDGFSGFYSGKMKSKAELLEIATQYKNTPLYSFDWCLGTSTAFNIKTRRGVLFGEGKTEFWRQGDKQASETVNNLYKQGINPLKVITEQFHKESVHVNATLRLNATYPPKLAASHNGPFIMDNPQFRIVNVQGELLWQLSYAHPEVRDFMLSVLEDAVACGVDGIHLQFLRHPPFFGVDKPLIAEYKKRYGSFDVNKDYMNEKWQKLQCEFMTDFISNIRQMLDKKGLKRNKKLTLSISFDFKKYYSQGLDVKKWVKSGWISVISPGYYGVGGKTFSLKPFVQMCQDTSCKIFPNLEMTLQGHDPTPDSESGKIKILRESVSNDLARKLFLDFYNQGAYGLYPFNSGSSLTSIVADIKGLRIWEQFEEPVIDWFSVLKLQK